MNITITSRHLEISEGLKRHIHERLGKLSKFYDRMFDVQVILKNEKYRYTAEFNARIFGVDLHASVVTGEILISVDKAIDKLESRIRKQKEKVKNHKGVNKEELLRSSEEPSRMIFREDGYGEFGQLALPEGEGPPRMMSVDEAVMRMEIEGMKYIVFTNAENSEVNVVYVRSDGNIGLIDTSVV